MPENARVWIYQASRTVPGEESKWVSSMVEDFAAKWSSHKIHLPAVGGFLYNRFIVFMVDEAKAGASGCSIDASVAFVKQLAREVGTDFMGRTELAYLKDGEVCTIAIGELRNAVSSGALSMDTLFFDNLVKTKSQFEDRWLVPLSESWMKRFV